MAINRDTTSIRRANEIDPKRGAAGSLAEAYRSHILKTPSKFRSSAFDPDTATLDMLKSRSGEISKAMTPAPRELEFSDTGNVRDVWSQSAPSDIGFGGSDMLPEGEMSFMPNAPSWSSGKDVTTGRILREHPDKFKSEGDPLETGGRFFKRAPAISRRIDPTTARPIGATGEDYGKPGGYKFIGESSSTPSSSGPTPSMGFGSPPGFGSSPGFGSPPPSMGSPSASSPNPTSTYFASKALPKFGEKGYSAPWFSGDPAGLKTWASGASLDPRIKAAIMAGRVSGHSASHVGRPEYDPALGMAYFTGRSK